MRVLDRVWPVSDVEHERWFAEMPHHHDRVYFAIESSESGHHIGNTWLWDIDRRHRRAELRIVVGERASHGHGCGTEAIELMAGYALAALELHKVLAYVLATNPRARRAFEKAGFELEGTLRQDRWMDDRYVDVDILARRA
jgi:RimJ/RimL family protein N-acetyltransferase